MGVGSSVFLLLVASVVGLRLDGGDALPRVDHAHFPVDRLGRLEDAFPLAAFEVPFVLFAR